MGEISLSVLIGIDMDEEILQKKIEELEQLITDCTALKSEWEKRIKEAKQARDNFNSLINELTNK